MAGKANGHRGVIVAILMLPLAGACGAPGETPVVLTEVPDAVDPGKRYLFYLHGQIVEDQGPRPTHPEFGVYEYQAILDTLAEAGFVVISERRASGTRGEEYARKVVAQVTALLEAGVPPERISVVGFSKGGGIAVLVSSLLANERVHFVFLGTCVGWIESPPALQLKGRVLSLYEASDTIAGSCRELLAESTIEPEFEERRLEVGGGHGAFYRPLPQWLDPLVAWVTAEGRESGAGP